MMSSALNLDVFLDRVRKVVLDQPNKSLVINSIDQAWKEAYKTRFSVPRGFGKFTKVITDHGHKRDLTIRNGCVVLKSPPKEQASPTPSSVPPPSSMNAEEKKDKMETTLKSPFIVDDSKSFWIMDQCLADNNLKVIAVDCEGFHHGEAPLCLLQLAFHENSKGSVFCFIIDVLKLLKEPWIAASRFAKLLESNVVIKVFHDCRKDVWAIGRAWGIKCSGVIDSQLAYELVENKCFVGLNKMLVALGCKINSRKKEVGALMDQDSEFWSKRPLQQRMISYASEDVITLLDAYAKLQAELNSYDLFEVSKEASSLRVQRALSECGPEAQLIMFDPRDDYKLKTWEVFTALKLQANGGNEFLRRQLMYLDNPTSTHVHMKPFLELLPFQISNKLRQLNEKNGDFFEFQLREIALDVQRRPRILVDGKWGYLFENAEVFEKKDMEEMADKLNGKFGQDNRAGFDGELHRISCSYCLSRFPTSCDNSMRRMATSLSFNFVKLHLMCREGQGFWLTVNGDISLRMQKFLRRKTWRRWLTN
eukprot:TRINITY_DN3159_c0_g1_i2.p1 TRINITY_DN3159_c0_g1~~TRINITY_DN3159_c0_g1_i2.p1  ORF type:complete len:535 (-),score=152.91 TRINITY_DN3159_c0_g1_i2:918-2522(-)